MTKPVTTGKVAQEAFELAALITRETRNEALDGLYLMLGEDIKAAAEKQRTVMERLDILEQFFLKMSKQQIHAARKLLDK